MNPDQLVLGLAVPYDEPARDDGRVFEPRHFSRFLGDPDFFPVPIYAEHRDPIEDREKLGYWRAFASVPATSTPAGMLVLGEIGGSPWARALLATVGEAIRDWGLSIKATDVSSAEDGSEWWLREISFTRTPAYESARMLAVGPQAADFWRTLTDSPVPVLPKLRTRTAYGPPVIVGKRVVRDEWQEPI